ncbi:hypothetical protein KUTeg_009137 [Tegillarca granosa]|uniref:CCHC-type domain-containing protein n=1 Tax=Tegillarca granosa TaxID=220873 RepID=A0ABQ9F9R0_TEGGR|nr:hypothetical protein KUTeg_009137 [Tegillarca granosa]
MLMQPGQQQYFRPEWSLNQWIVPRFQQRPCGRCGKFHVQQCFATKRMCFRCKKFGHYARMCRYDFEQNVSSIRVEMENTKQKQKSEKKKQRDRERIKKYYDNKRNLSMLPFSNLRSTAFNGIIDNACSIKQELSSTNFRLNNIKTEYLKTVTKLTNEVKQYKNRVKELEDLGGQNKNCDEQGDNRKFISLENRNEEIRLQQENHQHFINVLYHGHSQVLNELGECEHNLKSANIKNDQLEKEIQNMVYKLKESENENKNLNGQLQVLDNEILCLKQQLHLQSSGNFCRGHFSNRRYNRK